MTRSREATRRLSLRYGWNAMAYQATNPGLHTWLTPDAEAAVAYVPVRDRPRGRAVWVTAGSPLCSAARLSEVATAFERRAEAVGARALWFGAEERLRESLSQHTALSLGAQPVWDPDRWTDILRARSSVRAQRNRARNKGETVAEWPAARAAADPAVARVLRDWLGSRGLPALGFVTDPHVLTADTDRRVWVASRDETPVGYLLAAPIPARNGWLVEWIIQGRGAANGTATLLLDGAFRQLAAEGAAYVTLGLVPLSTHAPGSQPRPPLPVRALLAWMRAHARRFYDVEGLERFKAKFDPDRWDPVWLLTAEPAVDLRTLYAVASAFAGERGPIRLVARALSDALTDEARWLAGRWRS